MKTLLIIAVIAAIIAITAIKEDRAEALFEGVMFCFTITICSLFMWVAGKLGKSRLKRIKEDNEIRRHRMVARVKYVEVEKIDMSEEVCGF